MRVVVWYPAMPSQPSADEEDSLTQAVCVSQTLSALGFDSRLLAFDPRDLSRTVRALLDSQPDIVFNLVEETGGNPALNTLPAQLLETAGVAFTGSRAEAIALTTHKVAAKALLATSGLPTPSWIYTGGQPDGAGDGPFLLKPVASDSSLGIVESDLKMFPDADAARSALKELRSVQGNGWLAERYVDGREFNLSLLEVDGDPVVLPPAEMCFVDYPEGKPRVVGYRAKWDPDSFEYKQTKRRFDLPPEDTDLLRRLEDLASECWHLFHLRGYARVDFRVDSAGCPWILEINANPALAPDAGLAAAAERAGYSYGDLVGRIAASARERDD